MRSPLRRVIGVILLTVLTGCLVFRDELSARLNQPLWLYKLWPGRPTAG